MRNQFRPVRPALLVTLLATLSSAGASAQFAGTMSIDRTVGNTQRLLWEHAEFLVRPSDQTGTQVWLWFIRNKPARSAREVTLAFDFKPVDVQEWVADARFVLDAMDTPKGSAGALQTAPLVSPTGGALQLVASPAQAEGGLRLVVTGDAGGPSAIAVNRDDVAALLATLQAAARRSTWTGIAPTDATSCGARVGTVAACAAAALLPESSEQHVSNGTHARYGDQWGEAWAEFTVDEVGAVVGPSIEILYASNGAVESSMRRMVRGQQYEPARDASGAPRTSVVVAHWYEPPPASRGVMAHGRFLTHP